MSRVYVSERNFGTCPVCYDDIRVGEEIILLGGYEMHIECADVPEEDEPES